MARIGGLLIGVVVTMLVVGCKKVSLDRKGDEARNTAWQLVIAATGYRAEFDGACPTTEQLGKAGYLNHPASLPKPIATIDPWGKPYKITCTGTKDDAAVRSFGPDGVEGTDDDISVPPVKGTP